MNSFFSLKALAVGLAISASALAQAPASSPAQAAGPVNTPVAARAGQPVTQSSRIRAFNPGPDGQLQSLYLSNGSVVTLSPDLSRQVLATVTKGERVKVSGPGTKVNGQTLIAANQLTLHGQTFVAQRGIGPLAGADRMSPPPPPESPNPGDRSGNGRDLARLGPQGPRPGGPGPDGPPPLPRSGPRPPRPQAKQPAPPPPPSRVNRTPPPPSAAAPNAPGQPNSPAAPPAGQPASPELQPGPGGPSL